MKKIIVRADDLGYSKGINYGIFEAVSSGIINNVGVMVNMENTPHGVELLKNESISFGLHTNFSAGRPLTDPQKIPSLVESDGMFKSSKTYNAARKDFVNYEESIIEITAQYKAFLELFGKKPDYIDAHAIQSDNFYRALEHVANQYDLIYSGFPKNIDIRDISRDEYTLINGSKIYISMESMKPDYQPFDIFKNLIYENDLEKIHMMIFHPGYLDDYLMTHSSLLIPRTQEVEMLTNDNVKKIISEEKVKLVEFREL